MVLEALESPGRLAGTDAGGGRGMRLLYVLLGLSFWVLAVYFLVEVGS
jgi:hypothetical protein